MMDRHPVDTAEPADRLRIGADEIAFRVTSAASGGALVAAEVRMPAGGGPPGLHRHPSAEVYRVETGELALYVEDEDGEVRRTAAGPGGVAHIPGGRVHTIRNESGTESRAYVVFVPGAEMEDFARAVARLAATGPPRPEDVVALAKAHGIDPVGGAAPVRATRR
jgi:oxalate decarboxylase/phosphoglucose isomerase-like protein (cupin superfamily)